MKTATVRRAGWAAMTGLAALTVLFTARYLTLDPDTFLEEQRAVYVANLVPLILHVGAGIVAMALGPFQFRSGLRARWPRVHRVSGRIYLVAVLFTGVGGLLLAPRGLVGPIAPMGFTVMGVLLLWSSVAAFVTIRRGEVVRHRVWMIRSYALILGAGTLRLWLPVMGAIGVPFDQAYATAAWTCWLINLVVAERLAAGVRAGDGPAAVRAGHRAER